MGVRKKNFRKKNFFPATFLHLSQQHIVDTRGLRRQPKRGGLSHIVSELWGAKNFRQKNSSPRIGKFHRQISLNFLETIAFASGLSGAEAGKILKHADFEKLAPKICDMNPHSIFCILGVSPFSKSDDSNEGLVQHVVLRSILFTASIYLNPFSRY
jgi:hypothetical protein